MFSRLPLYTRVNGLRTGEGMVFVALESKWLKRKLEENAYVFGEHLDASARYIASKAPRVLPSSSVLRPGAVSSAAASAVWTQNKN